MARKHRRFKFQYKSTGRYDVEQREGESELQYYRRLAKVADQRLVRLEQLSGQEGFTGVTKMAYARAINDIVKMFGGVNRFNVKPPEDRRTFNEKIMAMRYFLESPTSTKGGIIEIYQNRADALNKKYGTDFTWKDLADYFGKGQADKLTKDGYGSKTSLYAIGMIKNTQKELVTGIKQNTNVTMEGPVTDAALAILRKKSNMANLGLTTEDKKKIRKKLRSDQKEKEKKTNA